MKVMNVKKFLLVVISAGFLFSACSKDDSNKSDVLTQAEANLLAKYPNAQDIAWKTKGKFNIASFTTPVTKQGSVVKHSAWFNNNGDWNMTESDLVYADLPTAIKTAFEASVYFTWEIDDIDYINRPGMQEVFIIEVEGIDNGVETEIDLYYSPDGILIKAIVDTNDDDDDYEDFIPVDLNDKITGFLKTNFPNASIIDVDFEDGYFEVEIIDNKIIREVIFDKDCNWVLTITEIKKEDLPQIVLDAFLNSDFGSYEIDDIEFHQSPSKDYYVIEIEVNDIDKEIKIDELGNIF